MVRRTGVSERDFNEIFPTLEDCYRAAYEQGLAKVSHTVIAAADAQHGWLKRMRAGLVALLGFCDDHPSWARLLLLETSVSVDVTCERRQQLHELLAALLDQHRTADLPAASSLLTSELIVGGIFSVIRTSMLEDAGGKLVELAPSLMAFIVAPYLGQAAAQAELEGRAFGLEHSLATEPRDTRAHAISRAAELPIRVTHRTTLVLRAIAQAPYSNNREVAQAAGLTDEGQASKLLARLERQGVIENVGVGAARGEPNAWLLTETGRRAVDLLGESFAACAPAARSRRARGTA